jgi:very-short-patch-repair endonuclease
MSEENTLEIDGVKHNIEEMTDQQKAMLKHVADLEQKLTNARFNLDQLQFSRQAFIDALKASLNEES